MTTASATRSASRPRPPTALFVAGAAIAAGAAAALGLAAGAAPDERWQLAARYTARCSFALFLPVYVASSWNRLWPSAAARAVVRRRRALGLAFAAAHTVHLVALVTYNAVTDQRPDAPTLVVGGGAYLAMFAMAATSNDAAVRRLGPHWRRLHRVGVHWLWFVFAFSYGGRTFGGQPAFAPLFAAALAALGLRVLARRKRRARA
jgi:DMSO/TMAO reductase YedYZ heme-binding membrane subunit